MAIDLTRPALAVNGGAPVRTARWHPVNLCGEAELCAVEEVLRSGYLTAFEGSSDPDPPFSFWGGPRVQQLERNWAELYGSKHAVSFNSATSGLFAALGALGVGFGDEVIVTPFSFTASSVGPLIYGAIPIFADVDPHTGCMSPESIGARVTPRTRAIIVVHQLGFPAGMGPVMELARRHGIKVIEDCAQAHIGTYKGRYVGTIGHIGVFSLNGNKTIQVGEGGVNITDDDDLRYRMALIRNHGENVVGPAGYANLVNIIGFNYRMTEVHAAMAKEQLKRVEEITARRLELVQYLWKGLEGCEYLEPLRGPDGDGSRSVFYLFPARFRSDRAGVSRDDVIKAMNAEGASWFSGLFPLYLQPLYQQKVAFKNGYPWSAVENRAIVTNYHRGSCPNAEALYFHDLMLNEHVRLPHTTRDMDDLIAIVEKVCG